MQPVPDEQPVPPPPVLVGEQHRLARRVGAGAHARSLQFHQRDQPVRLGLACHQPGQDPAEPHRLGAQRRPHPVRTPGRRVALVEHQVDDLEDRGQAARDLGPRRDLERHPPGGQGALGPHDALRDGGLGDQEGPGDLGGGQPAEQPQGEGGARLGRQHRMAGDKDQPQQVIADVIIHRVHVRLPGILRPQRRVAADFLQFPLVAGPPADQVDRPVLGRGHQPRARPVGHALDRPLLERDHQGVLRQFLGRADVPGDPGQARDQAGRFDPPHRLDRGPGGLVAGFGHGPAGSMGPITWRMSVEPVQPAQWSRCSLMKREAHSMASSFDLTSYSA